MYGQRWYVCEQQEERKVAREEAEGSLVYIWISHACDCKPDEQGSWQVYLPMMVVSLKRIPSGLDYGNDRQRKSLLADRRIAGRQGCRSGALALGTEPLGTWLAENQSEARNKILDGPG